MTSETRKNASRKEVRDSIREFAKQMSEGPAEKPRPVFELDAETARKWALIEGA